MRLIIFVPAYVLDSDMPDTLVVPSKLYPIHAICACRHILMRNTTYLNQRDSPHELCLRLNVADLVVLVQSTTYIDRTVRMDSSKVAGLV